MMIRHCRRVLITVFLGCKIAFAQPAAQATDSRPKSSEVVSLYNRKGERIPGTSLEADAFSDELMMCFRTGIVADLERQYPWAKIWALEIATPTTKRLLPARRIFVPLGAPTNLCGPYVYDTSGTLQIVHGRQWSVYDRDKYATSTLAVEFYRSLALPLRTDDDATQTAQLIEDLDSYGGAGAAMIWNSRGFTTFDKAFIHRMTADTSDNWKWNARREGEDWLVTREYIGPPASIMTPAVWVLTPGTAGTLQDLKMQVDPMF